MVGREQVGGGACTAECPNDGEPTRAGSEHLVERVRMDTVVGGRDSTFKSSEGRAISLGTPFLHSGYENFQDPRC
jgi:hypothetical protein